MAIYVAFDGPMDQHFMMHPEDLFGKPIESAQVLALTLMEIYRDRADLRSNTLDLLWSFESLLPPRLSAQEK